MSLGIYVEKVGQNSICEEAFECLNQYDNNTSLFFDIIGQNQKKCNFGMFNSSDIWYFEGNLVVTFLDGLKKVKNVANKNKIFYYFDRSLSEDKDLLSLIEDTKNVTVLTSDKESQEYFTRVTGRKIKGITKLKDIKGFF